MCRFGDTDLRHNAFLCRRDFGGRNDERAVGSVEFDHVILGRIGRVQEFVKLSEGFDFGAIDFLDDHAGEAIHASGEAVVLNAGEHDNVFQILEETFRNVVGIDLAETTVAEFVAREEIEIEGLENKSRKEGVAGDFFILN